MFRLLGVLLLASISMTVAFYSWNRGPKVTCTVAGLAKAAALFDQRAETRPNAANRELTKLIRRTRANADANAGDMTIFELTQEWSAGDEAPDPRACRRLRESLHRLS